MLKGRNHALWLVGGVSALAIATPAFAQAQSQQAPAAASESGSGLADIVVTAQKREQNLQAVPIAISAIPEAKVAQLGIKDAQDITGLAPNVTISVPANSMVAGVISIRGIPSGAVESLSLDQANGLYVDGVYIARSGAASLDVSDIERVEVLRGPQGTLFGRNTTGGAISIVTRRPSGEFKMNALAGVGNFGSYRAEAHADLPEINGLSLKLDGVISKEPLGIHARSGEDVPGQRGGGRRQLRPVERARLDRSGRDHGDQLHLQLLAQPAFRLCRQHPPAQPPEGPGRAPAGCVPRGAEGRYRRHRQHQIYLRLFECARQLL